MSIRNAIFILIAAVVVTLLLVTRFGTLLPFKKEKGEKTTDPLAKPASKPERPDIEFVNQFFGQPMDEILTELADNINGVIEEKSAATALVSSLPNAPFPFPKDAKPLNETALKQYIQTVEDGNLGKPTLVDLWRYNLASAALGKETESLPEEYRIRVSPDIETENFPVHFADRLSELTGPIAIGNFDESEALEIVSHGGSKMWTLAEDGSLKELPDKLTGVVPGNLIRPADYDGDGDLDLLITRRADVPNSLLQNDGSGNFTDVTIDSDLLCFSDTVAAEWVDYDLDGLIDLIIGNADHPLEIYRQAEPGKFVPFSWELDLWIPKPVEQIKVADFNNDGYPDIFLSISGSPNQLLLALPSSRPVNWRFSNAAKETSLPFENDSVVVNTVDFDNDGDLDLLIGKRSDDSEKRVSTVLNNKGGDMKLGNHLRLLQNDGEGVFEDVTEGSGLDGVEDVRRIHVMDLDSDGFEDVLAVTGDMAFNFAFWNRGGVRFRDISVGSRLNYLNSPEDLCSIDMDSDGSLDLFLADNEGGVKWVEVEGNHNGWLELKLSDAPPGTKISLLVRDTDWILQPLHRIVGNIPQMTIGLGQVDKIEQIEFYPPQATTPAATLKKVRPNQSMTFEIPESDTEEAAPPLNPPS